MSADRSLAQLDRQLARKGEDIILRRPGTPHVEIGVRAFVRSVGAEPVDGNVDQSRLTVIMSPTPIIAGDWPGEAAQTDGSDPRVPRRGDKLRIAGVWREIMAPSPVYEDGRLVRIELRVEG